MTAYEMVCSLVEAADLDKGLVGLDLEFLIRGDLGNSREFHRFLFRHGFQTTADATISKRTVSLEQYYEGLELIAVEPMKWSQLSKNLAAVLAFLKRDDEMEVLRIARADASHLIPVTPLFSDVKGSDRKRFRSPAPTKVLKLPRAKVPANFSAACHFHFDVKTWFKDAKHAEQLVTILNSMVDDVPMHLPAGRYGKDSTKGGNFYAGLRQLPDLRKSNTFRATAGAPASAYFDKIAKWSGVDRYMALNVTPVAKGRGDIEFRFMHSSLNLNTIDGWFRTLAELISYSESHETGDMSRFRRYADKEAPDVVNFLDQRRAQSFKSQDPTWIQGRPRKSMQRHFKPSMPPKKEPTAAPVEPVHRWRDHINDPGDNVSALEDTLWFIENALQDTGDGEGAHDTIEMLKAAQEELTTRLERLRPATVADSLAEARIPLFRDKVVLFLGDQSKLVVTKGGTHYFINGALRARADSLRELETMLRDPIADRGGLVRTWVDPT